MRAALLLAAFALGLAPAAPAQTSAAGPSGVVRYGKWISLGVAAAATGLGVQRHERADDAFASLRTFCGIAGSCALGADGRYASSAAEALYQAVVRNDREARAWLIAGQAALVGTVVLFILDLRHQDRPGDEPYSGLVLEPGGFNTTRVGLRIPLPEVRQR